jgi:predicted amidophosphoribosyltransferase
VLFYGLFGLINQRCPRCAKSQSRVRNPRFCYNCGLRLRE